jgi:rubrerythrin
MREMMDLCQKVILSRSSSSETPVETLVRHDHVRDLALIEYLARSQRLSRQHVEEALEIQREQSVGGQTFSLEEVFLEKGFLDQKDLLSIEKELRRLRQKDFNRISYQLLKTKQWLDSGQLRELELLLEDGDIHFMNFIRKKNWLEEKQRLRIEKLIEKHQEKRFHHALGQLALERELISPKRLKEFLAEKTSAPLGVRLVEEGFLKADELRALLDVQKLKSAEYFFAQNIFKDELRFRDEVLCPGCGKSVFLDDTSCPHCQKPLETSRRETDQESSDEETSKEIEYIADLEVIAELPSEGDWYLKGSDRIHGPYTLSVLQLWVQKGKLSEKHRLRQGEGGRWQMAYKIPSLARCFGICYQCGHFRETSPGACPSCHAMEA